MAEGINDAETVALAVKYEQQHGAHVAVLERKLEAQEAEAQLAEGELGEMMSQLKAANAGVGSGTAPAAREWAESATRSWDFRTTPRFSPSSTASRAQDVEARRTPTPRRSSPS